MVIIPLLCGSQYTDFFCHVDTLSFEKSTLAKDVASNFKCSRAISLELKKDAKVCKLPSGHSAFERHGMQPTNGL